MSMFNYKDFKHAFFIFLLSCIVFIALVWPLQDILPDYFDSWVPDFLANKSILMYAMPVGLLTIIIFLWRKK